MCVRLTLVTRITGFFSPGGEHENRTAQLQPHFLDVFRRPLPSVTGTHWDFPAYEHTKDVCCLRTYRYARELDERWGQNEGWFDVLTLLKKYIWKGIGEGNLEIER